MISVEAFGYAQRMSAPKVKVNKLSTILLLVLAAVPSVLSALHEAGLGVDSKLVGAISTIATLIAGLLRPPAQKALPDGGLADAGPPP